MSTITTEPASPTPGPEPGPEPGTASFSSRFVVPHTPEEVYAAIVDVGSWWTGEIDGPTDMVGGSFTYRFRPHHHSVQRVAVLEPGRRVVWEVVESRLASAGDDDEWAGTEIRFEIDAVTTGSQTGTEVRFTHLGLTPDADCCDSCSAGWSHYIAGSLRHRITDGVALPVPW